MTSATPAETVVAKLTAEGYERLSTPFKIANVTFDFTAALRGELGRSLDLVLVVDTTEDRQGERIRQRVEALSRALDVARSRLVLTTVLVGAPIPPADVVAIGRVCRVLPVEPFAGDVDDDDLVLEDALRVLLPLRLSDPLETIADPLRELQRQLATMPDSGALAPLLEAALKGADSVRRAFAELIERALEPQEPHT